MVRHPRKGLSRKAAANAHAEDSEEIIKAKTSIEVDVVRDTIENCCLRSYMSKAETVAFLLIEQNRDPAFTEIVWDELERENPEFFREYKVRVVLKHQISKFNRLLLFQLDAMMSNYLQSAAVPGPVPNGDPTCSNPNSLQRGALPQNTVMYPQNTAMNDSLDQNGSLHGPATVGNTTVINPMMNDSLDHCGSLGNPVMTDASIGANRMMDGASTRSGIARPGPATNIASDRMQDPRLMHVPNVGAARAPAMNDSIRMQQHPIHNLDVPNSFRHPGMSPLGGMQQPVNVAVNVAVHNSNNFHAPGMDIARMYTQPTDPSFYDPGQFGVGIPCYDHPVPNRPIFPMSTQTILDMLDRYDPMPESINFSFPPIATDIDPILNVEVHEGMFDDTPNNLDGFSNDLHAPQEDPRDHYFHYQNPR